MTDHARRLRALRQELRRRDLHGFVVPLTDEHLSEYVGGYARRLEWLTGFTGSAGTAAVLEGEAAILVDGRYTLQVRDQVSGGEWSHQSVPQTSVSAWLAAHAGEGQRIGYDPWAHTRAFVAKAAEALGPRGATLVAVEGNPVDAVWADRPAPSPAPLTVQPDALAGRTSAEKRGAIAGWLGEQGADLVVVTALDSIAWLFNIRGTDVEHTPVALAFAAVAADGSADLFVAPGKLDDAVRAHLGTGVRLHGRDDFPAFLGSLAGRRVAVDPDRAVAAILAALEEAGAALVLARDPAVLAKAIKTEAELAGHRAAQLRDGAAVTRFLHWLAERPAGTIDELTAQDRLHAFRRDTGLLRDLSFPTIAGAGGNGAIVHYRADAASNRMLADKSLFLIDSGGQYQDGTTDITRTVAVGDPTAEMRDRFTRVLQGHIALATAVFPEGTRGSQLDVLARLPLWAAGLDYAHGTGHGVGAFLSVHEGPQRISPPGSGFAGGDEPLAPGMILSNEPGYYKAGDYGIRIENLVLVERREVAGADKPVLGFETLTFAPIDRRLIDLALLTRTERAWVDAYHARVRDALAPELAGDAAAGWLMAETAPLAG